ncbi:MAG TPA: type 2 lanthipeptide synthetase LanM [Kofleriaceae bacterium]|nr:type 2 lanthipeptide synthetase LanM [Kofleriaceae bacterium]
MRSIDQIVRRATGFDAEHRIDVGRLTERQRARWRSVVADGDDSFFARRVAWDRLDRPARAQAERPAWAALLADVIDHARGRDVIRPFVEIARRRLGAIDPIISRTARRDLERALRRQLRFVGEPTLAQHPDATLETIARRYPVLARVWATITEQWIVSTGELIARVRADAPLIAATFARGRAIGRLARVDAGLGDRHRDGRTVAALTFSSGLRLVYKPRRLGLEQAFGDFLAWCNDRSGGLELRAPAIVARGDYGWVELVEPSSCRTRAEIVRFHERAGMLLAIFYLLGESDCHSQNLIACGEHPIPLDLETLLRPARTRPDSPWFDVKIELEHDVARTAMLPFWARSRKGGGIGHTPYPEGAIGGGTAKIPPNRPRLRGAPVAPEAHVEDIVRGFTAMYRVLERHRDALLDPDGPLAVFAADHAIRYIARGTGIYELIQNAARHPDTMRDGRERAIVFDALSRNQLGEPKRPASWPIAAHEIAALERVDVPLFHASPIDRHLRLDGGGLARDLFAESGLDGVHRRARSLDDRDLARQVFLIRAHFVCFTARRPPRRRRQIERWPDARVPSADRWIDRAIAIGDELERTALPGKDGALTWLAPEMSDLGRYQLMRLGPDYGGGAAGIALFLAAIDRVTGARRFAPIAERALMPFRAPAREADGLRGIAATIYALTAAGDLLGDRSLHDDARRMFALVTPARVAADKSLDLTGGTAGLLLAALALHRRTGDAKLVAIARALGDHLLARREDGGVWRTGDGHVGVGLLHGQSGFGLALARLARATSAKKYRAAAEAAFAFERTRFSRDHGEWIDTRPRSYRGSVCKGAAGILLARLGARAILDVGEDCDTAISACASVGMLEIDHVCCGNFGRIEAEALAGDVLERPALREAAARKAQALVDRADALGGFSLLSPARAIAHPSLYVGVAGVGYTLLRLAAPRALPSLISWE